MYGSYNFMLWYGSVRHCHHGTYIIPYDSPVSEATPWDHGIALTNDLPLPIIQFRILDSTLQRHARYLLQIAQTNLLLKSLLDPPVRPTFIRRLRLLHAT